MKNMMRGLVTATLVAAVCASACSRDSMATKTYRSAKQQFQASAPRSEPVDHPVMSAFAWDTPSGWSEQSNGSSSMRIATFAIAGSKPSDTTNNITTIIALGGQAGGTIANVNRWREQVGLSAQDEQTILKASKEGKSRLGAFRWFEIINEKSPESAMLVAIVPSGEVTLFVKMTASVDLINGNREKFLSLCKSLRK